MEEGITMQTQQHELLIRVDERTKSIQETLQNVKKNYVTQTEFEPVQLITYGFVGIILTAVLISLIGMVILKKKTLNK